MASITPFDVLQTRSAVSKIAQSNRDFAEPIVFDLQEQRPWKTIDIGKDGTLVSLDLYGRLLAISIFHPEHGIVVAEPFEQFDGSKFYDVPYVRKHRTRMLQAVEQHNAGFGLDFGQRLRSVSVQINHWHIASLQFTLSDDIEVHLMIEVSDGGKIVQSANVRNTSSTITKVPYSLNQYTSLNRASYGQLTEGGPIILPESHNILQHNGHNVQISNPALGARLDTVLEVDGQHKRQHFTGEHEIRNAPLDAIHRDVLQIQPFKDVTLLARFRFSSRGEEEYLPKDNPQPLEYSTQTGWYNESKITTYILRRNVDYVLANCVIPISQDVAAVITDHVALPLGWNRDNYWQVKLLFEAHKSLQNLVLPDTATRYADQIRHAIEGHLNWVFLRAERPHIFWHRSYLVMGKPKDKPIFQLDQQCYPLLELCDYLEYFKEETAFVENLVQSRATTEILALLISKRNSETGLWPTDETPGDDAVIYPYHFSSHVLLWRTLTRLRDTWKQVSPEHNDVQKLDQLAEDLRERTLQSFASTHLESKRTIFAYLTDGHERHTYYHDANDIPTLFAAEWGFVETPEELKIWKNTMNFGFSAANTEGYCNVAPFEGLGSVHSPGTWVLGYFQELAYAVYLNDSIRMKSTWQKIAAAMQWDGTFSEAVDPRTAHCSSKAWFSWPGAMIGTLLIQMKANGMERILLEEDKVERRQKLSLDSTRPSL